MILKKIPVLDRLVSSFNVFRRKAPAPAPAAAEHPPEEESYPPGRGKPFFSSQKQAELDLLCNQLFRRKELITSGKLQFLGLASVKKRLGKRWAGLSKIIYDIVEKVINQYTEKGDIFIPYREDSYILIFAYSSLAEGQIKAKLIAQKIQEELFSLEEQELHDIEIARAIREMNATLMLGKNLPDVLDDIMLIEPAEDEIEPPASQKAQERKAAEDDKFISVIETTEVSSKNYIPPAPKEDGPFKVPPLNCAYLPIWDSQKGALTTYMCLARAGSTNRNLLDAHNELFTGRSPDQKAQLDIAVLENIWVELAKMEQDGRKLFVVCPVQHDTLYKFETNEKYRQLLAQIPPTQRQFLILLVVNSEENMSQKSPFWFMPALKGTVRKIFVETPLRNDINFQSLLASGFDAAGIIIEPSAGSEQTILNVLKNYGARAKSFKLGSPFVLNVSSLSMTTSAVCAGFDLLGGSAIHEEVSRPDSVHKYRNEDLLKGLIEG